MNREIENKDYPPNIIELRNIIVNFAVGLAVACLQHFETKRHYVLFLNMRSLRNFINRNKIRRNSLHAYSVGLLFPHLFLKVFSGPAY